MDKHKIVPGVCCAVCKHFDKKSCPVQTAFPWSRYSSFCHEYKPNPNVSGAVTLEVGIAQKINRNGESR